MNTTQNGIAHHPHPKAPAAAVPVTPAPRSPEPTGATIQGSDFNIPQLDAIIAGLCGRIGRMCGSQEADATWLESASAELGAMRRARRALMAGHPAPDEVIDPNAGPHHEAATLPADEPNPYSRFTVEELDAMIEAAIGRRERIRAGSSWRVDDRNGLLIAEDAEIGAMREARNKGRAQAGPLDANRRGTTGRFDAVTVYSEDGDNQRIELDYHTDHDGADFPAAKLKLLIPYNGPQTRYIDDAGKAAIYDAFLFAVTGHRAGG